MSEERRAEALGRCCRLPLAHASEPGRDEIEPLWVRAALGGGVQRFYAFGNGWAASVIRTGQTQFGSAGLWELAVMPWTDPADLPEPGGPIGLPIVVAVGPLEQAEVFERVAEISRLGPHPPAAECHPSREGGG